MLGLLGHSRQLQNEVSAGHRYFYGVQNGSARTEAGKAPSRSIAVVSAAGKAAFDFPAAALAALPLTWVGSSYSACRGA